MKGNEIVLVGTVGDGIARSEDGGETWLRVTHRRGIHQESHIYSIASAPTRPEVMFCGTNLGVYRSEDAGAQWQLVESPLSEYYVWVVGVHPRDHRIVYACTGTPTPATIFRSEDSGASWRQLPIEVAKECPNVGLPRFTALTFDPDDPDSIWAGIEVDGLRLTRDGGDTWHSINGGIPNPDIHNVVVAPGPPRTVVVLVNDEIYSSTDYGATWSAFGIKGAFPMEFPRGLAVQPGHPSTLLLTMGDDFTYGPEDVGRTGMLMRSKDIGKTWENLELPVQPNSAMWSVGVHPADEDLVMAASFYGYLYRSDDGGDSWRKLWREVSQVSSIVWIPG